mmetsp:Transcript_10080/g.13210  ORF Transcript_10080/g.13210 Transcript_10080/m.13210 type:complete len:88 (-) Transcript_10080:635-898(-)
MEAIRHVILKIPKLAGWAARENRGHSDIIIKVSSYLNQIGEHINKESESNPNSTTEMWNFAANLCSYTKGGIAMQDLYVQLCDEQEN